MHSPEVTGILAIVPVFDCDARRLLICSLDGINETFWDIITK